MPQTPANRQQVVDCRELVVFLVQEKTALAETAGSKFLQTCIDLLAENRNAELLEYFLKQLDPIFGHASGKGWAAETSHLINECKLCDADTPLSLQTWSAFFL